MKRITLGVLTAISIIGLITLNSCSDSDPKPVEKKIDITDATAVSTSLTITNADRKVGTPPAPTNTAAAPVLNTFGNPIAGGVGKSTLLGIDVASGDVAGVYLQVKGADEYFDIPASSLTTNGRLSFGRLSKVNNARTEEDFGLSIGIPDNITTGEFCVLYCIYDSENNVSNIVEVCITILEFGGANSQFLTSNQWSFYKSIDKYDGEEEIEMVGVVTTYEYNTTVACDDQSFKSYDVVEEFRTDFGNLTLGTDGGLNYVAQFYSKDLDFQNTTCDSGPVYTEETDMDEINGAWAYDDTTKKLTLVFSEADEEGDEEPYFETFNVVIEDGNLVLTDDSEDEDFTIIFKPKL